jgi:flagellar biosynthesis component FlhA
MINHSEFISIPVKVELCKELTLLLKDDQFLEQFVFEVEVLLGNLLDDLGISGKANISVSGGATLKPMQVFVHELQLRYPPSIFRSIWEYASGKELGQLPPDYDVETWLTDIFTLPENSKSPENKINSQTVTMIAGALALFTTSIISRHVEKLVGAEQATALLNYGKHFLSRDDQKIIEKLAPESLEMFLKEILQMRISISDAEIILREISKALKSGSNEVEITEALICRLRPPKIDIEINPAYLRQIIGFSPEVKAISVWSENADQKNRDTFTLFSDGIFYELGIRVPDIRFVPDDKLGENTFALRINHLRTHPVRGLQISQILVNESPQYLAGFGVRPAVVCRNPSNNRENSLVDADRRENLESLGMITWDAAGYIILVLAHEIRRAAGCFVDAEGVEYNLALIDQALPQLVSAATEMYSTDQLAGVFRSLLAEGLSIRDMRSILERLLHYDYALSDPSKYIIFGDRLVLHQELGRKQPFDLPNLVQYARSGLKEYLSHKYTYGRGQSTLTVYLLDTELEKRLVEHLAHLNGKKNKKPLSSKEIEKICQSVRTELSTVLSQAVIPAILTMASVRFFLREILAAEFPDLPVLSYDELSPATNISPIARIYAE